MADETSASFALDLEVTGSSEALDQAQILERLQAQINGGTEALTLMNKAMRNLKGAAQPNTAVIKDLKDKIAATKASVAGAQAQVLAMGGTFQKVKPPVKETATNFDDLLRAVQRQGGPLGRVAGALGGIKIGAVLAAAAIAAVAAAMLAAAAAAATAYVGLIKYGLAQADVRRSEMLRLEGLTKIRFWNQRAADSGSFLQSTIDKVSGSTALARGEVGKYAEQLYRAGLRGGSLEAALEGIATVSSVQGDAQAQLWSRLAIGAARSQGGVRKLADDVKARLGGIASKQLLSLTAQQEKLKENFSMLFSGLKIEGVLKAFKMISDLFSQNTVTGRTLKQLIEVLFQPMISFVEKYGILFKRFFQGIIIGAQLLTIAILRVAIFLKEAFGNTEILKGFDAQRAAMLAGVVVFGLFAGAVMAVVFAFGILAALSLIVPALLIGLVLAINETYNALVSADWKKIGNAIVQGIADGITGAAMWPINAIKKLGSGMIDALRTLLKIRSPSKLFAGLGLQIPLGVEVGVKGGTPRARRAVDEMIEPAKLGASFKAEAAGSGSKAAAPTRPTVSVTIEQMTVGGNSSREQAASFIDQLVTALEGVQIQMAGASNG